MTITGGAVMTRDEGLIRQITPWGVWVLAVNGMIGAGIFAVPAGAAAAMGAWSPLIYLVCAALLGVIIACFAEIATRFRETGGPVLYVRTAFGRFAGYQTGMAVYATRVTAFAANVNLLVASLGFFWADAAEGPVRIALIALVVGSLALLNVAGARPAMQAMGALTLLKLLPLLALAVVGLFFIDPGLFPQAGDQFALPAFSAWGAAALLVIYAFVGWESALIPAGETRNPARAMPLGLFWALGVVALLYVVIQTVAVGVLPDLASSERALVDVAAVIFGPVGALILTAGVIVSVGGNIAGTMVTAPRLTYAMAREETLPSWFAKIDEKRRTPAHSIVFFALLGFVLAVFGSFVWLAMISAFVRVLVYLACIAAMPRLRQISPQTEGGFILPWGWTIPLLAVGGSLVLLSQVGWQSMLYTALFLAGAAALYVLMGWLRAR